MLELDDITGAIIDSALEIHRDIGPGALESAYELFLAHVLANERGLGVERRKPIPILYRGVNLGVGFRADLVVERSVIVELKSVERLAPVHPKQLLTYLKLSNLRVGLLINFGQELLRDGIRRVVNDLPPSASPRLRVNQSRPAG